MSYRLNLIEEVSWNATHLFDFIVVIT